MMSHNSEIDQASSRIVEDVENCKDSAIEKKKMLDEEKQGFQNTGYTALDMLSSTVTGGDALSVMMNGGLSSLSYCIGTTLIGCKCDGCLVMTADSFGLVSVRDLTEAERIKKQKRDSIDIKSHPEYNRIYNHVKATYGMSADDDNALNRDLSSRQDYYLRHEDLLKVHRLGAPGYILLGFAGYIDVKVHIMEELETHMDLLATRGQVMNGEECADMCVSLLNKEYDAETFGFSTADLEEHPTSILVGTYETDMEYLRGDRYPVLFHVTKRGKVEVDKYFCDGKGKFLADKVMNKHFSHCNTYEEIGKEEGVLGLRQAMEAASLTQLSGGIVRTVTLDENNYFNTAAVDRYFYE